MPLAQPRAVDRPIFDAYAATCYVHPKPLVGMLVQALQAAGHTAQLTQGPAIRFYAENLLLVDPAGHRLVQVRHGGSNVHPFVEAKGIVSEVVADCLRSHFDHVPARLDSAYDLSGPTVFLDVLAIARDFEARLGLKLDFAGAQVDNPDRGTTGYLGSRKSQAFVRFYQKGLQIAEQMGLAGDAIPDELRNWVRIELEYKPDKRPARERAARLSPTELWGCSPWTRQFAKLVLSIDAERVTMSEKRESNQDRAMRFLVQQYGPTILRQVQDLGSWEAFLEDLQSRLGVLVPA